MMSCARALLGGSLSLVLLSSVGCSGDHDAMEKQLGELRAEVSRLRAAQANMSERIDNMDATRALAKSAPPALTAPGTPSAPAAIASAAGDRPTLDVVRLAPSEGDGDAVNDPSRPVVRVVGDAAARPTLNNHSIPPRGSKKSVTVAPKKTDGDARPAVNP